MRVAPLLVDVDSATTPTTTTGFPKKSSRRSVRRSKTTLDGLVALKAIEGGEGGSDKENATPANILGEVNCKLLKLDHHDKQPHEDESSSSTTPPPPPMKEEKEKEEVLSSPKPESDEKAPQQQQQPNKNKKANKQQQKQQQRQDKSPTRRGKRGGKRNQIRKSKTFAADGSGGGNNEAVQSFLQHRQNKNSGSPTHHHMNPHYHQPHQPQPLLQSPYSKPELNKAIKRSYVAMDCEMVGIGKDGQYSSLARVTLVNWYGDVILDEYIQQDYQVTDYRTFVSGITPELLADKAKLNFADARKRVWQLLQPHHPTGIPKILVGHALQNDLGVLGITHPPHLIRDTAKYEPYMKQLTLRRPSCDGSGMSSPPGSPGGAAGPTANMLGPRSLKDLTSEFLERQIQTFGQSHSSFEDAVAALDLYKHSRVVWESALEQKRLAEQQHHLWMQHQMHLQQQQQHFHNMGFVTQMRGDGSMMVVQQPPQQRGGGFVDYSKQWYDPQQQKQYGPATTTTAGTTRRPGPRGRKSSNMKHNQHHRSISPMMKQQQQQQQQGGGGVPYGVMSGASPRGGGAPLSFETPRRRATMGH